MGKDEEVNGQGGNEGCPDPHRARGITTTTTTTTRPTTCTTTRPITTKQKFHEQYA